MKALVWILLVALSTALVACFEVEEAPATATAFPSPTPVATPAATPTPTATAIPTAVPPPTPTPTSIPVVTPTSTPIPTVTPTPLPTATPMATPIPPTVAPLATAAGLRFPPPLPAEYSGAVTVDGKPARFGTVLYARMGDYESDKVAVREGRYEMLFVSPPSAVYVNQPIEFFVNDVKAAETGVFAPGSFVELDLSVATGG